MASSFAAAKGSAKLDNNPAALKAKIDIRARVLKAIVDAGKPAAVFDAFAGSGQMFSGVWSNADHYVGCDLKWIRDGRMMFAADNRRVLRSIELAPFNIFDFDAWGSCWEQAIILSDRRRVQSGELLGLALTNGDGRALALRANLPLPYAVRELAGLRGDVAGVFRQDDVIENRVIYGISKRMNCEVLKRWLVVGTTGAKVRYLGLVLRGK